MGKREMKITSVQRYLSNVAGSYSSYTYGKIPSSNARNACSTYAGAVRPEDILGLVDITILGDGKKGLLFTEYAVYFNNGLLGNSGKISYKQIYESGSIPNDIFCTHYNQQALIELLSLLATIEGEEGGWQRFNRSLTTLSCHLSNAESAVDQIGQTVNSAIGVMEGISNIISLISSDNSKNQK